MQLWFSDEHTAHARLQIRLKEHLYSGRSEFQRIDIYDSHEFGRVLILDGVLMLSEMDEFVYHEMLVHVPMAVNPLVERVLVIGAGDGGIVRELVRYGGIKSIDMVEIDEMVVAACRAHLPATAGCLDDPRLRIYYEDGLRFVRNKADEYDLIIVDSTDPVGPGEGLFTKEFYGNCYKALTKDGIMVNQMGGVVYADDIATAKRSYERIKSTFPVALCYQAHVCTYPGGLWLLGYGSKGLHPAHDLKADKWRENGLDTRYYNTDLHTSSFVMPNNVKKLLEG